LRIENLNLQSAICNLQSTMAACNRQRTTFVNLTNPVNALITDGQGMGTIVDGPATAPPNIQVYLPMTRG
jgi:hypothetical protein